MSQPIVVPAARKADEGPGGDDQGDDDGDHHGGGDDDGDGQHHQHGDDDQRRDCDATALTTGAVVGEAELKTTAAGLVFRQIEIVG
jgi:hypothetical protein